MKKKTIIRLGKTYVLSTSFTFSFIYFFGIILGQTEVMLHLNDYGEAIIELPLLLALLPFGMVWAWYQLRRNDQEL